MSNPKSDQEWNDIRDKLTRVASAYLDFILAAAWFNGTAPVLKTSADELNAAMLVVAEAQRLARQIDGKHFADY